MSDHSKDNIKEYTRESFDDPNEPDGFIYITGAEIHTGSGWPLRTGKWTYYYEDNSKQIKREGFYEDDEFDGEWNWWYSNGQKKAQGKFKKGKKEGKLTFWYDNGMKLGECDYRDGKRLSDFNYWDENGNQIPELPRETIPKGDVDFLYRGDPYYHDNDNIWLAAAIFGDWINNTWCNLGYYPFIDSWFLVWRWYEDDSFRYLDKEDLNNIIYYYAGSLRAINNIFKKYEIGLDGAISKTDLIEKVLSFDQPILMSNNGDIFPSNLLKESIELDKRKYKKDQKEIYNKGKTDFLTWVEGEKYITNFYCKCDKSALLLKNDKIDHCEECDGVFEFHEFLYEKEPKRKQNQERSLDDGTIYLPSKHYKYKLFIPAFIWLSLVVWYYHSYWAFELWREVGTIPNMKLRVITTSIIPTLLVYSGFCELERKKMFKGEFLEVSGALLVSFIYACLGIVGTGIVWYPIFFIIEKLFGS